MKPLTTIFALNMAALLTACAGPMGPMSGSMAGRHGGHLATTSSTPAAQEHLEDMRAMRDKMSSARTSEERQGLMDEHMKALRGGMDSMRMMDGMQNKAGPSMDLSQRQQRMEEHLEMMHTMMEMMLQRMPR